jgi:NAD(P)-dependent dehydrogenase (short-subunit alcohol dehydrogenase family)
MTKKEDNGKNVLILGGYGKIGRAIAGVLARSMSGRIAIAGRNRGEAESCASQLQQRSGAGITFEALAVDMIDRQQVADALEGQDLVIVCVPLSVETADNIASAVNESEADYLDVVAGEEKHAVFRRYHTAIMDNGKRFILNAGVEPGLPAWLALYTASLLEQPQKIRLFGKYRDRNIGPSGIQDILNIILRAPKVFDRQWKTQHPWSIAFPRYPGGFGRSVSVPIFLNELESIPELTGVRTLRLFQAGINPVCDIILTLWKLGLGRVLRESRAISGYQCAMQRFTPSPLGIAMIGEGEGLSSSSKVRVTLWHDDLYQATALVAVIAAERLLATAGRDPGQWFLGEWVSPEDFRQSLEHAGFSIEVNML